MVVTPNFSHWVFEEYYLVYNRPCFFLQGFPRIPDSITLVFPTGFSKDFEEMVDGQTDGAYEDQLIKGEC